MCCAKPFLMILLYIAAAACHTFKNRYLSFVYSYFFIKTLIGCIAELLEIHRFIEASQQFHSESAVYYEML